MICPNLCDLTNSAQVSNLDLKAGLNMKRAFQCQALHVHHSAQGRLKQARSKKRQNKMFTEEDYKLLSQILQFVNMQANGLTKNTLQRHANLSNCWESFWMTPKCAVNISYKVAISLQDPLTKSVSVDQLQDITWSNHQLFYLYSDVLLKEMSVWRPLICKLCKSPIQSGKIGRSCAMFSQCA